MECAGHVQKHNVQLFVTCYYYAAYLLDCVDGGLRGPEQNHKVLIERVRIVGHRVASLHVHVPVALVEDAGCRALTPVPPLTHEPHAHP
eukprot:1122985-Prorocentrum_minimum.AAC.2